MQLKIENQSLNEKIEERNEELLKLRKKTTVTVQVSLMQGRCVRSGPRSGLLEGYTCCKCTIIIVQDSSPGS